MILLPFILSAALDMSLPEFQPEQDLSGNYVIGEYDVSEGDFEVSETEELPDGLTVEASEQELEYNLLGETNYLTLTRKRNTKINNVDGQYFIQSYSSYNYYIDYTLLSSGVTYDLDYNGVIYIGSSVEYESEVFIYSNSTITPSSDIYIIQYHQNGYYLNVSVSQSGGDVSGGDVSGDDTSGNEPDNPSGGNFDDTALLEVLHDIQMQLRCILFVCIWKFILPLAMKIRDHVFGLKHE